MSLPMIEVDHVSKEYRLGAIGGTTLNAEIQSKLAKIMGREDPNLKIGSQQGVKGERFLALNDVSFSVQPGEAVGIIGHNGAGKSTLLKLISRITAPTGGEIRLRGRVSSMLEVGTGFHPELTGRENVYLNGAILGMSKKEIDSKFDEIVSFAEMGQFIDTPIKRYSSGMFVKLAFAIAAHLDNEMMIMDEVLAVGDAKFQQKCLGRMGNAAQNEGRTVLYVSHNMSTVRQLCTRCIVLDHGRLVYDGSTEKAIEIYLGLTDQFQSVRYFENAKRSGFFGDILKITRVEFLDTQDGSVENEVKYKVTFKCLKDEKNIHVRAELRSAENYTVGTSPSPVLMQTINAGEEYACTLSMNIENVMPGKFSITLLFYTENEFGNTTTLDRIENALVFDVSESKILRWVSRDRGYIKLPDLQLLEFGKE